VIEPTCVPFKVETWPLDADGFAANLCTDCGTPVRYGSRHGRCLEPKPAQEPKPARILRLLAEAQKLRTHDTTLAEALEFRREAYDLSRSEFAAILGLALGHYGEILSGKRDIPKGAMRRAYAIGVPAGALLQPFPITSQGTEPC